MYFQVKNTLKYNCNQTFKHNYQIFYTCFLLYINFNHNFYQLYIEIQLTITNYIFLKFNFTKTI
jgi:hypothetical protein